MKITHTPNEQIQHHANRSELRSLHAFLFVPILFIPLFIFPHVLAFLFSRDKIFDVENSPKNQVAIVFGAGLRRDGTPTSVLKDRVYTASQLYFSGKVEKILMSGANHRFNYNEPLSMKTYAVALGVPDEDIVLDLEGNRTYDTCYRARHVFGIENALLVTQQFHLPRALLICNFLGVKSSGVIADQRVYRRHELSFWRFREIPATFMAFLDIWIRKPLPALSDTQPIIPIKTNHIGYM